MGELTIGQALNALIHNSNWSNRIHQIKIKENWEVLMGKTIAKYTDEVDFKQGTLFIYTTVAPLKQELLTNQEAIISRVNEFLKTKAVKKVIIK